MNPSSTKNKLLFTFVFLMALKSPPLIAQPYKNKNAAIETRVQDLVARMNLKEKILQLNQYTFGNNTNVNNIGEAVKKVPAGIGSLIYFGNDPAWRNQLQKKAMEETRLGIPILFGFDVIHGFKTVYPISLAQACSWNPKLVEQLCAVAAKEAKLSGVDWTFSPMIDVTRDPRWGRISEGYGEDPYVNSVFGVASVNGYQGKNLSAPYSIAACLKHYVGYGASEGGRDYSYTDISAQSLWETYLPPYKACIEAGAATVMSAFNDISGVPATANHYTLTEILKNKWQHDGFVVSDWNAIEQLVIQGVAKDRKEAALKAFLAGTEMNMTDNVYFEHLEQLVAEKKIPIQKIDDAVSRILTVKFRLGLFDRPYTNVVAENQRYLAKTDIALAQKMAAESMVLLKNKDNILPLDKTEKTIALIGPMARDKENIIGSWSAHGKSENVESIEEGLKKELGDNAISYAKGCDFDGNDSSGFDEAIGVAKQSDLVVICLGEKKNWSGENGSRSTIALPKIQEDLMTAIKKSGKKIILILSSGRPLELVRLEPLADAIIEIWQPGIAGGTPLAKILSGKINPSGKLAVTFPLTSGQIPIYYNMRPRARHSPQGEYQDIPTAPLYWFGHGLSYTSYAYTNLKVSDSTFRKNQKIKVSVSVANTGNRNGVETVLWYLSDPAATTSRPMKELKHFEKKEIKAGGVARFELEIDPIKDLSYPDATGKSILESGDFFIYAGNQKIKITLLP